jgi:hypothetical protein
MLCRLFQVTEENVILMTVNEILSLWLSRYSDGLWVRRQGQEIFSCPQRPDQLCGSPSLLSNGYRGMAPEVERPGCETDHSPPSDNEIKNEGAIPPLPRT